MILTGELENIKYMLDVARDGNSSKKVIKKLNKELQKAKQRGWK